MILMRDVEGYQVGEKVFKRGEVYTDERGIVFIDQAYHLAWREMNKAGLSIVTLGPHSEYDRTTRAYVR